MRFGGGWAVTHIISLVGSGAIGDNAFSIKPYQGLRLACCGFANLCAIHIKSMCIDLAWIWDAFVTSGMDFAATRSTSAGT